MWPLRKPRDADPILSKLDETNGLLREIVAALTGSDARTLRPRTLPENYRIRTEADIVRMTRQERLQQQRETLLNQAPWRGPVSPASDAKTTAPASEPPSTGKTGSIPLL